MTVARLNQEVAFATHIGSADAQLNQEVALATHVGTADVQINQMVALVVHTGVQPAGIVPKVMHSKRSRTP